MRKPRWPSRAVIGNIARSRCGKKGYETSLRLNPNVAGVVTMIAKAAIKLNGRVYTGNTHADALFTVPATEDIELREYGFITETGEFLDRADAYKHALACEQIRPNAKAALFSYMLTL